MVLVFFSYSYTELGQSVQTTYPSSNPGGGDGDGVWVGAGWVPTTHRTGCSSCCGPSSSRTAAVALLATRLLADDEGEHDGVQDRHELRLDVDAHRLRRRDTETVCLRVRPRYGVVRRDVDELGSVQLYLVSHLFSLEEVKSSDGRAYIGCQWVEMAYYSP